MSVFFPLSRRKGVLFMLMALPVLTMIETVLRILVCLVALAVGVMLFRALRVYIGRNSK